jgi:hypothetical protein
MEKEEWLIIPAFKYYRNGIIKQETKLKGQLKGRNKILMFTEFDWESRPQRIKEGPHGNYVNIYKNRWYIDLP